MHFSRSSIPCRNSANDQAVATYTYDPFGRRLWKTVAPNQPGNDSASPKTTCLYYTDEGYAAEYTHNGNHPNSEASITPVLSQLYLFAPQGLWSTEPLAIKQSGEQGGWRYPETDHLGTPHGLISKAGQETTDLRANAFGQTEVTGEPLPLRFAGQTEDDETGGYYNFHRDYEPNLGRYIESDPIKFDGGVNFFSYAYQNAVSLADWLGWAAGSPDSSAGSNSDDCDQCKNVCDNISWIGPEGIERQAVATCCGGKPYICDNPKPCMTSDGKPFPENFCKALKRCTRRHENLHVEKHLPCGGSSVNTNDPDWRPNSECEAWKVTISCMKNPYECTTTECKKYLDQYLKGAKIKEKKHPGANDIRDVYCSGSVYGTS